MTADLDLIHDRLHAALLDGELPGPREVMATLREPASDALLDRVDDAQHELGGRLEFMIGRGEVCTFAKVHGNPWDLHDVLVELQRLGERFPLDISYEPENDIDPDVIARWVARYPRPAPRPLDGARLICRVAEAQLAAIRAALVRWPAELDGNVVRVTRLAATHAVAKTVLDALAFVDAPWSVEIVLDGPAPWRAAASSFTESIVLGYILDAVVPREPDVDPDAAPEPPPPPLPVLSGDEQLEYLPPPPRQLVRTIGEVAGEPVRVETVIRLGRIKHWLHWRGERSRAFINAGPFGVDADRVVLVAERDGAAELLSVALPGFAETVLRAFERDARGIDQIPREVVFHAGRVILAWSTREDTRLVRDDGAVIARLPGSLVRLTAVGEVVYAFTADLYRIDLADGSVRAAGTRTGGRLDIIMNRGRWYAWSYGDAGAVPVAEDARVVRTFRFPDGEVLSDAALSPRGTLAVITRAGERYTLHVVSADRSDRYALDGEVDGIRFVTSTAHS